MEMAKWCGAGFAEGGIEGVDWKNGTCVVTSPTLVVAEPMMSLQPGIGVASLLAD